jgi:glutamyl-tRNA reductase
LREKVAFSSEELDTANQKIRAMLGNSAGGGIKEVAILSTCNRTEIYCAAEDSELASKKLKEFLAESKGVKFNELEEHLYVFLNDTPSESPPAWIRWCSAKLRSSVK